MTRNRINIEPNVTCPICGTRFYAAKYELDSGGNLYCSVKCRGLSMRKHHEETCENCGNIVIRQPSLFRKGGNKRTFCNKSCFGQWRKRFNRDGTKKSAPIKRNVTTFKNAPEEYGSSCLICGHDRVVDYCHIVPARDGGTSHPDNIISLCPNHHRLMDRNLLTPEEDEIITDYVIRAWGSPSLP